MKRISSMNLTKKSSKSSLKKSSSKRRKKPDKNSWTETSKDTKSSTKNLARPSSSVYWKTRPTETNSPHWADGTQPDQPLIWFHSTNTSLRWNPSKTKFITSVEKTDQSLKKAPWLLVWSEEGMKSFCAMTPLMSTFSTLWESTRRRYIFLIS